MAYFCLDHKWLKQIGHENEKNVDWLWVGDRYRLIEPSMGR
ncbi:hypothetical protein ACI8B_300076 [Acinetobacter proteolyticus]|uniref:Uncharacterized protein n=1 Tax=Acinetobacter proteolyticus TaxID=1776741 RepID=A0A653K8D7_9GAMM|nr:hypothetical protein ACI8B_300076 [Acinetobacter proteolyticus]